MELGIEIYNLKKIKIDAVVIHKKKNTGLISRLIGPYGGIFCEFKDPETGKKMKDFIIATKGTYDISRVGDVLSLTAYRAVKDKSKVYLRPDEAVLN